MYAFYAFYNKVTDRARQSLEFANHLALRKKHPLVTNLHVLWGILEEGFNVATTVLTDMKIDLRELKAHIEAKLGEGTYASHDRGVCYDVDVRQCICDAIEMGLKRQQIIGCNHLLSAILLDPENKAAIVLDKWNVTQELVDAHVGAIVKHVDIF